MAETSSASVLDFECLPSTHLLDPLELQKEFELEKIPLFIAAPMVRYSNLAFRNVVRSYGADLLYTPMLYANNLVNSYRNRSMNWGWNLGNDFPILQLAASNGKDFADAMELAYNWTDGVDLNCGCPKQSVRKMGCGSALLRTPELIADIIRTAKARAFSPDYPISCKLRILSTPEKTVDMCRMLEKAGADRIALHIRTVEAGGTGPTSPEFAALVKSSIQIPLYVNGGVSNLRDVFELAKKTSADGIMVANGILENPALFKGYARTPLACISKFVDSAITEGMNFDFFHQHLIFMMRHLLTKKDRQNFNHCNSVPHILDFLNKMGLEQGGDEPRQ